MTILEGEIVPYEDNKIYYPENFSKLIPCQNEQYNFVGEKNYSLSKSWFIKASGNGRELSCLSNNAKGGLDPEESKLLQRMLFGQHIKRFCIVLLLLVTRKVLFLVIQKPLMTMVIVVPLPIYVMFIHHLILLNFWHRVMFLSIRMSMHFQYCYNSCIVAQ